MNWRSLYLNSVSSLIELESYLMQIIREENIKDYTEIDMIT